MSSPSDADLARLRRELVQGGLVRPAPRPWRALGLGIAAGVVLALAGVVAVEQVPTRQPEFIAKGGSTAAASRVGIRLFLADAAGEVQEVAPGQPIVLARGLRLLLSTTNRNDAAWSLAFALVRGERADWLGPVEALAPKTADEPVDRDWATLVPGDFGRGLLVAVSAPGTLDEAARTQLARCLPRGASCPGEAAIQRWSLVVP